MTRAQIERKLIAAYAWRQRRYAKNVHGLCRGRNCFSEENMVREITELENQLEELGGDPRECLQAARARVG